MMIRRKDKVGGNFFDTFVLLASILSILAGIVLVLVFIIVLDITNYKPYLIAAFIFLLGIWGFRVWRSENID